MLSDDILKIQLGDLMILFPIPDASSWNVFTDHIEQHLWDRSVIYIKDWIDPALSAAERDVHWLRVLSVTGIVDVRVKDIYKLSVISRYQDAVG